MSCPYYWYNDHYACRKTGKDVNEDTYYKYCRNYDYDDCPIYKGNDTSGCFLTSACVEAMGLLDDCRELTVLRAFRDDYLAQRPGGKAEICEYYHIAPQIVEKIKSSGKGKEVFTRIYEELVKPCVELIEGRRFDEAHYLYQRSVLQLQHAFFPKEKSNT